MHVLYMLLGVWSVMGDILIFATLIGIVAVMDGQPSVAPNPIAPAIYEAEPAPPTTFQQPAPFRQY